MKRDIEYWGAGFLVQLLDFPVYEDEGWYGPDVPLNRLHLIISRRIIAKPHLLTGAELAELRGMADLTRSEAARKLGVTRRTLINWEERQDDPIGAPPLVHLGLRARFFGWLFPGEAQPAEALKLVPEPEAEPIAIRYADVAAQLEWPIPQTEGAVDLAAYRQGRKVPMHAA
jgi:transcriptional regulator with XRE-family HTH domain